MTASTKSIIVIVVLVLLGGALYTLNRGTTSEPVQQVPAQVADQTPVVIPLSYQSYGSVTLSLGAKATFADVVVSPVSIAEDSRCPINVNCIQAGRLVVNVDISTSATTTHHAMKVGDTVVVGPITTRLVSGDPARKAGVEMKATDYRLTFDVEKQ